MTTPQPTPGVAERIRYTLTGAAVILGVMVLVGFTLIPGYQRAGYFTFAVPLTLGVSLAVDYFLWSKRRR